MPRGIYKRIYQSWNKGLKMSDGFRVRISNGHKGQIPWNKNKKMPQFSGENHPLFGKHHTEETKQKISLTKIGVPSRRKDYRISDKLLKKLRDSHLGHKLSDEVKKKIGDANKGVKNHRWIVDRSKPAKRQERNDMAYKEWRMNVWKRDNFKCKIANNDCNGKIEAHHILGWTEYAELRYEVNNGITLCHAHHPRKRMDEKRLSPYFQELVALI